MQAAQLCNHPRAGQPPGQGAAPQPGARPIGASQILSVVPSSHFPSGNPIRAECPTAPGIGDRLDVADLQGLILGPEPLQVSRRRVAFYVETTGDQSERWGRLAPPGMAGAALFAVAPQLLSHPAVMAAGGAAVHGEQVFKWKAPLRADDTWFVRGEVKRVRHRRGIWFVDFAMGVADGRGEMLVEGASSFLIAGGRPPAPGGVTEEEPRADRRGDNQEAVSARLPEVGAPVPGLCKSASRSDLIRYAAATGDWNPIHWDHRSAVEAGLSGVVVHGLACATWMCQGVTRLVEGDQPLQRARFRFRRPLRPAVTSRVEGERTGENQFAVRLESHDSILITAAIEVRS